MWTEHFFVIYIQHVKCNNFITSTDFERLLPCSLNRRAFFTVTVTGISGVCSVRVFARTLWVTTSCQQKKNSPLLDVTADWSDISTFTVVDNKSLLVFLWRSSCISHCSKSWRIFRALNLSQKQFWLLDSGADGISLNVPIHSPTLHSVCCPRKVLVCLLPFFSFLHL